MIRIIPKDDLKVMNPDTLKRIPKSGIVVKKLDTFWKNRLKDGDIKTEKISTKKQTKGK